MIMVIIILFYDLKYQVKTFEFVIRKKFGVFSRLTKSETQAESYGTYEDEPSHHSLCVSILCTRKL